MNAMRWGFTGLLFIVACGKTEIREENASAGSAGSGGGAGAASSAAGGAPEAPTGGMGGAAAGSASVSVPSDDPTCNQYGFSYAKGCDDCPAAPFDCPCFHAEYNGVPLDLSQPTARCQGNHCLLGGNCTAICKGTDPNTPDGLVQVSESIGAVQVCATAPACADDDWCGAHEKCVREERQKLGLCSPGIAGSLCIDDADCWEQRCLTDNLGFLACRDGALLSPCMFDGDCQNGLHCAAGANGVGSCSSGGAGEPCSGDDCRSGLFCVKAQGTTEPLCRQGSSKTRVTRAHSVRAAFVSITAARRARRIRRA